MPGISVFKIEDTLPKRPYQPQRLGVVGQPPVVFAGDQDASDIVAGGEGLQVTYQHQHLAGSEALHRAAGEIKTDASGDAHPGELERRRARVDELEKFKIAFAPGAPLRRRRRMVHELRDPKRRIQVEMKFLQGAPGSIGQGPGANDSWFVQHDTTVIDHRRGHLGENEKIGGPITDIHAVNRQHVPPGPQEIQGFADVEILEYHRAGVGIAPLGAGIPLRVSGSAAGTHPFSVQVSNKSIVVLHPQGEDPELFGILDDELDTQVAGGVHLVGQFTDVSVDQFLVAGSGLVTDTRVAADPAGIVEARGDPVEAQGVVHRDDNPDGGLLRQKHLRIDDTSDTGEGGCVASGKPGILPIDGIVDGPLAGTHGQDETRLHESAAAVEFRR